MKGEGATEAMGGIIALPRPEFMICTPALLFLALQQSFAVEQRGPVAGLTVLPVADQRVVYDGRFPIGVRAWLTAHPDAPPDWDLLVVGQWLTEDSGEPLAAPTELDCAVLAADVSLQMVAPQLRSGWIGVDRSWSRADGALRIDAVGVTPTSACLVVRGQDWVLRPGATGAYLADPPRGVEVEILHQLPGEAIADWRREGAEHRPVYVGSPRSAAEIQAIQEEAPELDYRVASSRSEALRHAAAADGVDAHLLSAEFLAAATHLSFVQAHGAGVERYLADAGLRDNPRIVLANMKATHGPAIADHAFAMLLLLTRELRFHEKALQEHRWDRGGGLEPIALHRKTMLVVGLGGIGTEIARRARGFGMQVWATTRTPKPIPDYVDRLGLSGDLDSMLGAADVVALCVPLTDQTRGLFGAERIAAMKGGAILINVARGQVVDSEALDRALRNGSLGGACLDVTDPEPLPPDHPLWSAPRLVLTPHVSGRAAATSQRKSALFRENLRRFAAGEALLNVVDKQAGY